ncbi:hypothetical protein MKX03_014975 [Papaver bracteatum]|nr:hypothetical protein MKX03_014975 [Papaver bracteatum]
MEKSCSLLIRFDKRTPTLANEIKESLEGSDVVAMKKSVMLCETLTQLFITVVRHVLLSEDDTFTSLFRDKTDSKGKVLPGMILICQNLRNNLQHPYEYITKCYETEIIEPLIPSILANLEHCHPFIRRNAILAQLLVDAPEMIEKALSSDQDSSAISIPEWGEFLQMVVLELIRKVCRTNRGEKGKYYYFLAKCCYIRINNNVKLIVLDRLNVLKTSRREIMVDMIMDTIDIALELLTPRNIDEVVQALKKEVGKTQTKYSCAIKFSEVASTVVHLLRDFLGDSNVASAIDVVFVREIIETNPKLRVAIITRLMYTFYQICAASVCSFALWILGESSRRPAILADETVISPSTLVQGSLASPGNLRSLILAGDFFLGEVVALNKASSQALLVMVSMQLGHSSLLLHPTDNISYDKITRWLQSCRDSFVKMLADKQFHETDEIIAKAQIFHAQPDDLIDFYHLKSGKVSQRNANKLNLIFSDPVYAEVYVMLDVMVINQYVIVHHYDIVLDVMVSDQSYLMTYTLTLWITSLLRHMLMLQLELWSVFVNKDFVFLLCVVAGSGLLCEDALGTLFSYMMYILISIL